MWSGHIDGVDPPLVPLLFSGLPHECCGSDEFAVFEGTQVQSARSRIAEAERDGLDRGGTVFCNGFTECKRFRLECLEPDLPPRVGVAFRKVAYLHRFTLRVNDTHVSKNR